MSESLPAVALPTRSPRVEVETDPEDIDLARAAGVAVGGILGFLDRRSLGGELVTVPVGEGVTMKPDVLARARSVLAAALRVPTNQTPPRVVARDLPEGGGRIGGLVWSGAEIHEEGRRNLDLAVDLVHAYATTRPIQSLDTQSEPELERLSGCWRKVDERGVVLRAGPAWQQMGVSHQVGARATAILDPDSERFFRELVMPVLEQRGEVFDLPVRLVTPERGAIECKYSAILRRGPSDQLVGRIEVFVESGAQSYYAESTALARYAASSANVQEFTTFCLNRLRSDYGFELAMFVPLRDHDIATPLVAGVEADAALASIALGWLERLVELGCGEYLPDTSFATDGVTGRHLASAGIRTAYGVPVRRPGAQQDTVGVLLVASHVRVQLRADDQAWLDSIAGLIGLVEQRDQALVSQRTEAQVAKTTLSAVSESVLRISVERRIEFANPASEGLTGLRADQLVGSDLNAVLDLRSPEDGRRVVDPLLEAHLGIGSDQADRVFQCVSADGAVADVQLSVRAIRSDLGARIGSVLTLRDVTQAQQLSRELAHRAAHDSLTGLANRSEFEHQIVDFVERSVDSGVEGVVCVVDLDRFKPVNDTCGHHAGDELLRQIARHLSLSVRSSDLVARIGGDEFGVLLRNCGPEDGQRIADEVCRRFADFRFHWDDHVFGIGASIGVAVIDGRWDADEIVRRADEACYAAKRQGRNRVELDQQGGPEMGNGSSEWTWASKIQAALDNDRFVLFAQPMRATGSQNTQAIGAEILLRMVQEDGSLATPGQFLAAAERYGLCQSIDRWVVDHVFDLMESEPESLDGVGFLAINLSGSSLGDDSLRELVNERIRRAPCAPARIAFEVTETAAISNLERAARFLGELRDWGCPILLDDFGSRFSSFGYLRDLPASFVKIDGRFVVNMLEDRGDAAVVQAVHQIAKAYGLRTVAEHVEDRSTLEALSCIGVDYAQGYGVARPAALRDFLERQHGARKA